MSDSKEQRRLTIFVDEDVHKAVRIKAAPRDLSFQKVTEEALQLWLDSDSAAPNPAIVRTTDKELSPEDNALALKLLEWFQTNRNRTQQDIVEIVRRDLARM